MKYNYLLASLLSVCLFISCKKQNNNDDSYQVGFSLSQKDSTVYKKLIDVGFTKNNIVELSKYYLVDGDLLFDKVNADTGFITSYFSKIKNELLTVNTQNRHWAAPNLVSNYNIESLKIETDDFQSNGEITDWRRSAVSAMTNWAGIANTNINFTRYFNIWSGPRYINILSDGDALPSNVIAAAEFPVNGAVGFRIRINLDFSGNVNVPANQRVYNLAHEIGHCLGLRHTNWQLAGESQNGATAILTTAAAQDPNSVMNSGTANNSWVAFSGDDIKAAQALYPVGAYRNWITSPSSAKYPAYSHYYIYDSDDPISITWNSSLVPTPTVTLEAWQNGILKQVIASHIPNSGSFNYPVMVAVGGGSSSVYEVQIRIVSDANTGIFDYSSMFDIVVD